MKSVPRTILAVLAFGLLTSPIFCRQAHAAPIQGTIDFGGVVKYGDSTGADTTSLASATRVNLWNDPTFGPPIVTQRTGDFVPFVSNGATVTMAAPPWIFNSGTTAVPMPGPGYSPFWTVGGFTFNLTSSQVVPPGQSSMFLNVKGAGFASGNGFDLTPGTFTFSSTQSNGSNNPTFSFQSQTAVPEGSTVALCAIGGVCLLGRFLRRKIKSA